MGEKRLVSSSKIPAERA